MARYHVDASRIQQFAKLSSRPHHRNWMPCANFSEQMNRRTSLGEFFAEPSVEAQSKFRFHRGGDRAASRERNQQRLDAAVKTAAHDMHHAHWVLAPITRSKIGMS
jgi:hypothetical protein